MYTQLVVQGDTMRTHYMTGLVGFEYFKVKHNFINYLLQYFVSKNKPKRNSFQDSTKEILISEVQTRPCLWNNARKYCALCAPSSLDAQRSLMYARPQTNVHQWQRKEFQFNIICYMYYYYIFYFIVNFVETLKMIQQSK